MWESKVIIEFLPFLGLKVDSDIILISNLNSTVRVLIKLNYILIFISNFGFIQYYIQLCFFLIHFTGKPIKITGYFITRLYNLIFYMKHFPVSLLSVFIKLPYLFCFVYVYDFSRTIWVRVYFFCGQDQSAEILFLVDSLVYSSLFNYVKVYFILRMNLPTKCLTHAYFCEIFWHIWTKLTAYMEMLFLYYSYINGCKKTKPKSYLIRSVCFFKGYHCQLISDAKIFNQNIVLSKLFKKYHLTNVSMGLYFGRPNIR